MFDPTLARPDALDASRLLGSIAHRDEAALGALYDMFSADVFGVAVGILRDHSLAEDATQETFLAVWRNARSFRPDVATARAWITVIARNRSIDILRRRNARAIACALKDAPEPAVPDAWAEVVRRLDRSTIATLMLRLPQAQRRAIELAFLRGWSHSQIASATGLPLGTIKSQVRLGLLAIRRMAEADAGLFEVARSGVRHGPPPGQAEGGGQPFDRLDAQLTRSAMARQAPVDGSREDVAQGRLR